MTEERGIQATIDAGDKTPRTDRGRRTQRLLLDAAAAEFGEKGFHDSSIVSITSRAGVALGSFYTYFDSKESLFRALVSDMSNRVKQHVAPSLKEAPDQIAAERAALEAFLSFARDHNEIYRIIDEAEFVAPESYQQHYATTVERIVARLKEGEERGEIRGPIDEAHGWAIVGMNVFLGLRYGVMAKDRDIRDVAKIASDLLARGIGRV